MSLEILTPIEGTVQRDITIDIIAVPGLGADPHRSFGSEKTPSFQWLNDQTGGIPNEIPDARVLLYNYDSRWFGPQAIRQTLYNAAASLLDALVEHRKECDSRPLVFLAHSMGGLVVTKAITLAAARPEIIEKMRIHECFAGAIFFGTPFRGSSMASAGVLLAGVLEKLHKGKPNQMLQMLDPQRDTLEELRNDFSQLATKEPKPTIACIYELKEYRYFAGKSEIVVTQESATLDYAERRGLECDHRQLNRFASAQDPHFVIVRAMLKDIVQKSYRVVKKRLQISKQSLVDDNTFARLAETLDVVNFRTIRRKVETASGDSSWFQTERKYRQWLIGDDDASRFLWVSGVEGRGKAKAALLAVEELEQLGARNTGGSEDVLVAYFFGDSSPDSCKPENLLKSLIWQLILKRRNLGQYVKGLVPQGRSGSSNNGQDSISLSQLWRALRQMLGDPSIQRVYFVLNNLHFFAQDDEKTAEFFRLLADDVLINSVNDGYDNMKACHWMFLSRPQDHIKNVLLGSGNHDTLWIDLEDGSRDAALLSSLQSYIRDRVRQLAIYKNYSLALQFFVMSILSKRATSALWVEVVCRLLEGVPSNHVQVRKIVEALPQSLDDLISRAWRESLSVKTEGIDTSKEILRTLAIAYEDPTLDELVVMADLDSDADNVDADRVRQLIRACGPLLRIYSLDDWDDWYLGSQRVTFIHPMAKDALLNQETSRKLIGLSLDADDQTEVKWQHGVVALRCFGYVLRQLGVADDTFQQNQVEDSTDPAEDKYDKLLNRIFPQEDVEEEALNALEYPVKSWLKHGNDSTLDFSSSRNRWWASYAEVEAFDDLTNLTPMHVAANFGLTPLIDRLRDSWDRQPLHWAAFHGHSEAISRLLELEADVNDGALDTLRTPLHMAAANGQISALELLISRGAQVNCVAKGEGTPLTLALAWNQEEAANLLLLHGASSTLTSEDFDSPLVLAALKGFTNNQSSQNGHSNIRAVTEAARNGDLNTVRIILTNTYHLDVQDAFVIAASLGHDSVVRELWSYAQSQGPISLHSLNNAFLLLYEYGASANATGEEYGNVVTASAFDGTIGILNMLIEAKANLNDAGMKQAVELLLQNGATINAAAVVADWGADANLGAGPYTNPITAAISSRNDSSLMELLLSRGANPNVFGGSDNSTPLINAALCLPAKDLEVLIRYGARVDTVDADEDTALNVSASIGDDDCVKCLLNHRANVNFCGKNRGHIETCRLLLQSGADPTIRGGPHDTVLQAACHGGEREIVKLALCTEPTHGLTLRQSLSRYRHKIDVNARSPESEAFTALHAAARQEDDICLRLLLKQKPTLDVIDKNGITPLHAACLARRNRNARLLIEAGANPNVGSSVRGTVLQTAALKCSPELIDLLLERKAKTADLYGKYYSPLVAAVVRDYHYEDGEDVLEKLLTQDFPVQAYRAALDRAFLLGRKGAFKMIWKSADEKGPRKLSNLGLKRILEHYEGVAQQRDVVHEKPSPTVKQEDNNEDFSWENEYYPQDIEDDADYLQEMEDEQTEEREALAEKGSMTNRGFNGGNTREGGFPGNQGSRGGTDIDYEVGNQGNVSTGLGVDGNEPDSRDDTDAATADEAGESERQMEIQEEGLDNTQDEVSREMDEGNDEIDAQGDDGEVDNSHEADLYNDTAEDDDENGSNGNYDNEGAENGEEESSGMQDEEQVVDESQEVDQDYDQAEDDNENVENEYQGNSREDEDSGVQEDDSIFSGTKRHMMRSMFRQARSFLD
ncbi:ankyrin [Xylaria cubensis]|nr:ankyrin [Xylaria cubensis]